MRDVKENKRNLFGENKRKTLPFIKMPFLTFPKFLKTTSLNGCKEDIFHCQRNVGIQLYDICVHMYAKMIVYEGYLYFYSSRALHFSIWYCISELHI